MEDRQAREISAALKSIAGAITNLGISIVFAAITLGSCIASSHH